LAALVPLVLATAAGMVVLWPGDRTQSLPGEAGPPVEQVGATVTSVVNRRCPAATNTCSNVRVRVTDGPDRGEQVRLPELILGADVPRLEPGDRILLGRAEDPTGRVDYYFADFQRRTPLVWLALIFAVVVVAVGRWRGLMALIGLAVTWVVLLWFVLPAVLAGESPVAVALVGSSVMMLVVLYLTGGLNARTTTALLGTLAGLALTGALAAVFVAATHLTGLSSEEGVYLQTVAGRLNLSGVILAGIVIGALGALNDVTVTQASAVWELHAVDRTLRAKDLYRKAMRIGRDHIASVVDTLVLAYFGASLPLFIVFTLADRRAGDVLTSEIVAVEVVRTLVGSIGLVASVPLTTGLAAIVVASRTDDTAEEAAVRQRPRPNVRAFFSRMARPLREWSRRRRDSWRPSRVERDFWKDVD
jgi:uncharacterized membrane protein